MTASEEIGRTYLESFINSKDRLTILERAVEGARNGITITDPNLPDNPIVYANKAFVDLTGYTFSDILGKNCRFLQGTDHEQPGVAEIREAVKEQRPITTLLRNYKKNGTLFWNELSVSPVFDSDNKLINFIGVQNDVTARKEAETRVSEFYSMVSHELRTPLSSIRASLELIDDGSAGVLPSQAARLVNIALNNSQRLLKLVNDILDLKRIEAGKLALNYGTTQPGQLIADLVSSLSDLSAEAGVSLEKNDSSSKALFADAVRVTQVLTNLAANAIKFSSEGTTVTISAKTEPEGTRFLIRDQGKGIASADMDKLFRKFQQLDSSDTRAHAGSGLGLAVSKLIVELHGGTIGVESKVGEGSTFWFVIPNIPPG